VFVSQVVRRYDGTAILRNVGNLYLGVYIASCYSIPTSFSVNIRQSDEKSEGLRKEEYSGV
jgi:hypothetical protein